MEDMRDTRDTVSAGGTIRIVDVYAPTALSIMAGRRLLESRCPQLKVELLPPLETGPELISMVVDGRADVAPVCELPIFEALAAGAPVEVVGITGTFRRVIMVPANSPLRTPKDLVGKRVACVKSGGARTVLARFLAEVGLTESDIAIVDTRPSDALAALGMDTFDAWSTWSPWAEQAELDGQGRVLVDISHVKTHGLDFVVRQNLRTERPEVLSAFLDAYTEAGEWALANPDEAAHYCRQPGIDLAAITQALRSGIHFQPQLNENVAPDLVEGLRRAHELGLALNAHAPSIQHP